MNDCVICSLQLVDKESSVPNQFRFEASFPLLRYCTDGRVEMCLHYHDQTLDVGRTLSDEQDSDESRRSHALIELYANPGIGYQLLKMSSFVRLALCITATAFELLEG